MATVFTKIIEGELPGRFVWNDDQCVAFLSINPLRPGHVLVVPRREVEHWIDLDVDLWAHLTAVSQTIGAALQNAYSPAKVGLMLAGLEVPHVHVHLVPIDGVHDLDFANADPDPDPADLDAAADAIREALRAAGHPVPEA
ncbi:MAG TPA: HIT family protein [Egibacteraceae bacterium]|nr:HIT family protein [Egibacteraceae bacterium]